MARLAKTGKKASKTTAETAGDTLIRQPHGGSLRAGGKLGNSGGKPGRSGPKPTVWREQCRQALEHADTVGVIGRMVVGKGEDVKPRDQLGAADFLAKYGHGLPVQPVDVEVRQLLVVRSLDAVDGARGDVPALPAPEEGDA